MLVSKEDLERIKEIHKSAFKTRKRDLTKMGKGTLEEQRKIFL